MSEWDYKRISLVCAVTFVVLFLSYEIYDAWWNGKTLECQRVCQDNRALPFGVYHYAELQQNSFLEPFGFCECMNGEEVCSYVNQRQHLNSAACQLAGR